MKTYQCSKCGVKAFWKGKRQVPEHHMKVTAHDPLHEISATGELSGGTIAVHITQKCGTWEEITDKQENTP